MIINPKKQNLEAVDNIKKITDCVSNPNLLDNWYFGNPVDQRGGCIAPQGIHGYAEQECVTDWGPLGATVTAHPYSGTAYKVTDGGTCYVKAEDVVRGYTGVGYTIDRWTSNGTVVIANDHIKVDATFFQKVETSRIYDGAVHTFSFIANNRLYTTSAVLSTSKAAETWQMDHWDGNVFMGAKLGGEGVFYVEIQAHDTELNIEAVKLELGTQQTLAHQDENGVWVLNEISDYAEELAKCVQSIADGSDTYANKTILHTGNKDQIFTYGTSDLTAGTSSLESGKLYFVYE